MTAFDRKQIDSVKNLIEGNNDKKQNNNNNKTKKHDKKKTTLYKRPSFDKKVYSQSRAQKLKNNYSILEDEREYKNNVRINNIGNQYEVKEYNIVNSGDLDILKFEKMLKSKGIHVIEIKEKNDFLKNQNKNENDTVLQFKIREEIYGKKKSDKLKSIEKELKKENKKIKIKIAPKEKSHRLRSADYVYKKEGNTDKKVKIKKE